MCLWSCTIGVVKHTFSFSQGGDTVDAHTASDHKRAYMAHNFPVQLRLGHLRLTDNVQVAVLADSVVNCINQAISFMDPFRSPVHHHSTQ